MLGSFIILIIKLIGYVIMGLFTAYMYSTSGFEVTLLILVSCILVELIFHNIKEK